MKSRFGEVDVNITEEEKDVLYILMENGQDLKRAPEAMLEGYESLLDKNREKVDELLDKEDLTLADAEVMRDILERLYNMCESNDYLRSQSGYVFSVTEPVRSYSLKEKVDW